MTKINEKRRNEMSHIQSLVPMCSGFTATKCFNCFRVFTLSNGRQNRAAAGGSSSQACSTCCALQVTLDVKAN